MKFFEGVRNAILPSLLLWALLLLWTSSALAGTFMVSPVRIFMALRDRAVALEVTNTGSTPVQLRAELNTWSQSAAGEDLLEPTDDIVLSPPVVKLAPGERQVVRLVRLAPANPARQNTYRMLLREVRAPGEAGAQLGMNIELVLSIPVFVTPPKAVRAVACSIAGLEREAVLVDCANRGDGYAQVTSAVLTQGGQPVARFAGPVYLLPGSTRTLAVKGAGVPGAAQLVVSFDDRQARTFDVALP